MKISLRKTVLKTISGEWGDEDLGGIGVNIIRTANFENNGKINFTNLVKRLLQKKTINSEGKEEYVVDHEKIRQKALRDDDIIIEKSGGGIGTPVGRVVYFKNPNKEIYLSNNFTQILRIDNDLALPKYIYYYLRYLYKRGNVFKYQNQTTGIFNLKLEKYLQEEIFLPDFDRQNLIITQLDGIQDLIDNRIESISICEKLKKSIFIKLFVDNTERDKWNYEEISKYTKGTKYGIAEALNIESGFPTLRMNNITYQGTIDLSELKFVDLSQEEYKKYELQSRDIIFNRTNSVELVGKCAVWGNLKGYVYAGYLFTIKLNEKLLNPYYLSAYLNSDLGKTILKNKAKQSGNMANFSASLLKKQKILCPPISLQKQFEKEITKINLQIEFLNKSKMILQDLFQAVLQNAFKPDAEIDEGLIFKNLIKRLKVEDLKGNKKRLQYLLNLFEKNNFDNSDHYGKAKEILYKLIICDEIEQKIVNNKISLEIK